MISEVLIMHRVWMALYILPSGWRGRGGWLPASLQDFSGARVCSLIPRFLFLNQEGSLRTWPPARAWRCLPCPPAPVPPPPHLSCVILLPESPQHSCCHSQDLATRLVSAELPLTWGALGFGWGRGLRPRHTLLPRLCAGCGQAARASGGAQLAHLSGPGGFALPCLWWSARSP